MSCPSARVLLHSIAATFVVGFAAPAAATEVALAGVMPNRAVVSVNGGSPRTLAVGSKTSDGSVKLLAIEGDVAVFEIDGKKQRLVLGDHAVSSGSSGGGAATATLMADGRGQFMTQGSVNGATMRFMVDTGATFVALSASDAARAGIDYKKKGQMGAMSTANGVIPAWRVPGNTVRLGDITLYDVEVTVQDVGMPFVLLGMSFLNRLEMKRDGDTMTLKKRY